METLAVVATKGGVGKTTLAVHLAAAAQGTGLRVLLLDLDPQGSAAQWGKDRARLAQQHGSWFKAALDVRKMTTNTLTAALDQAEKDGVDIVIIDTPPHADYPAARAAEVADLILMPIRPGYFDLHAAKATLALVQGLKAPAFFVVNQVPHNNLRIADDAAEYLEGKGLRRTPGVITYLQPYVRALRDGLTAPELVPDGRHAQEIGALWTFVRREMLANPHPQSAKRKAPRKSAEPSAALDDPFADIISRLNSGGA